jgi:hypothetical protein
MRIQQSDHRLVVRHCPILIWGLYCVFVLGGAAVLALSLGGELDAVSTVVGALLGLANVLGGFYLMARRPASVVELDATCGEVRVRRWSPGWSQSHWYTLANLKTAKLDLLERPSGRTLYRPMLHFAGSERVPVSLSWMRGRAHCELVARRIEAFRWQKD